MDDLRKKVERQFIDRAGAARGSRRETADHRRRGAAVLPGASEGVHRAGVGHAARDLDRGADDQPGRAGRCQRRRRTTRRRRRRRRCARAIVAGEDFAKVAAEVSVRPSKANGGLIGPFAVTEMSHELQELLEKMKPGDITQPIRTRAGLPDLQARDAQDGGRCSRSRASAISSPTRSTGARSRPEMRKFLDARPRARRSSSGRTTSCEGVRAAGRGQSRQQSPAREARIDRYAGVVRHLDALAARAGRPRADRPRRARGVPADHRPMEPLEGPEEEDRLAAFPGLLFRAVRRRRAAADPEVHRRRQYRLRSTARLRRFPSTRSKASAGWSRATCSTIRVRSSAKA